MRRGLPLRRYSEVNSEYLPLSLKLDYRLGRYRRWYDDCMALVIILSAAMVLFLLAFVTKRRFGVLGLGLAAGVVLSQLWSVTLTSVLQSQQVPIGPLSYSTLGQVAIILIPSLLLLIGGPKYHNSKGALVGSLLYAAFAALFIIAPITRDFAVAGDTSPVFEFIAQWQNVLIALGVVLAIIDMIVAHGPKFPRHGKEKH